MKKKVSKHSIFKAVLLTLGIIILLTWILPAKTVGTEGLEAAGRVQVGLFDFVSYLYEVPYLLIYYGLYNGIMNDPMYILVVGAFYGLLYKTNAYRNLLDRIKDRYEGREWIFLTLVMILFAVLSSVAGMSYVLIALFPLVFGVMMLMGYSKVTAVLTTVGSVAVGTLANTYYNAAGSAAVLSTLSLAPSTDIVAKIIVLVLAICLLVFNVLRYAKAYKISEPRKGFTYPETKNKKAKVWPLVLVLDCTLLILLLAMISWSSTFNVDAFSKALEKVTAFEIAKFPIFGKIFGTNGLTAFGAWGMGQIITLFIVSGLMIMLLCKVKFNDAIDGIVSGLMKAIKPAALLVLVYTLIFITGNSPVLFTIIEPILKLSSKFDVISVFTVSISSLISHLMNVDLTFSSYSILSYVQILFTDTSVAHVIGFIVQATYGLAMLFVPTSVILVAVLSYTGVSYVKYLKAVWKLVLELFALIILTSLLLIKAYKWFIICAVIVVAIVVLALVLKHRKNN